MRGESEHTSGRVNLRLEVFDRVQVGQVDPALVRLRALIAKLLNIEAVEQHVYTVNLLEEHHHLHHSLYYIGLF